MSTDEMTGVQALERKHPGLPMLLGHVERREYEYIRHGTLSFIVNFEVATGQIATVLAGDTRNEAGFVRHIQRTVEGTPWIDKWHFVTDNLNTHQSESLVRDQLTASAAESNRWFSGDQYRMDLGDFARSGLPLAEVAHLL